MQVLDGRAEIDGIGRVGCQIFFELDNHGFIFQLDVGFLAQRRRNHHVLVGIFEGDVFIESDFNLLSRKVDALIFGHGFNDLRRRGVLRPACGCYRVGAPLGEEGRQQQRKAKKQIFQFPNHGAKVVIISFILPRLLLPHHPPSPHKHLI